MLSISELSVPAGLLLGATVAMWMLFLERLALVCAGKKDSASLHGQITAIMTVCSLAVLFP